MQPREGEAAGYGSTEAKPVTAWLRAHGVYARPLGNVVYFMVTPTTAPQQCTRLLRSLLRAIDESATGRGAAAPQEAAAAHAA
jgi:dethiobiotin synthetase/adenosylmethionine--8-amino-7-oxononanoate aminotransferase